MFKVYVGWELIGNVANVLPQFSIEHPPETRAPHITAAASSAPDKAVNVLQRMCKLQKRVQVWAENTSGT